MRRSIFIAGLMLFGSAGCASTKSVSTASLEPTSRDYYPLQVGAWWQYAVSYPGQKGEMTVQIEKEKDGAFIDNRQASLRHTADGLRDADRYLIRNPLKAGNAWKAVVSASAVEHYKIVSVGEKCDCTAGQFEDCLVVESSIRKDAKVSLIGTFTFAKNVGLIKIDTSAEVEGKGTIPAVHQELIKYGQGGNAPPSADGPSSTSPKSSAPSEEGAPAWEH